MKRVRYYGRHLSPLRVVVVTFAVCMQAGCIPNRPAVSALKCSGPDGGPLGTIGVVAAAYAPHIELYLPATNPVAAARRGALRGLAQGLQADSWCDSAQPYVAIGCLALTLTFGTTGAAIGSLVGVSTAPPPDMVARGKAVLKRTLARLDLQRELRDQAVSAAQRLGGHPLTVLRAPGPSAPGQSMDYRASASQGITTVLETHLFALVLSTEGAVNQALTARMVVQGRVVSAANGAILYELLSTHRAGPLVFQDWVGQDGERFQKEIEGASRQVAEQLVSLMFVPSQLATLCGASR